MGSWIFAGIVWVCAGAFIVTGLYALRKKTPMHFWSGTVVSPEEIRDTKNYNKQNAWMWLVFGAVMALLGVLGLFWTLSSAVLLAVQCIAGIPLMALRYNKIYETYKTK